MKTLNYKVKIGIVGCGAIGSRMAKSITKDFKKDCRVAGLFDIKQEKSSRLAKSLGLKRVARNSLDSLINQSDVVVEAVNSNDTYRIVTKALSAKKTVLAMSVGRLL